MASAIAYVVFGLAHSLWLLFLSRLIQGAGGGTTGVANAYIADSVEPGDRARALGWLSAATSAGVMLGPVIGSVAAHGGRAMPGFVAAALCILNFAFAWKLLPESHVNRGGAAIVRRPVWESAWQVLRHPDAAGVAAGVDLQRRHARLRFPHVGAGALPRARAST